MKKSMIRLLAIFLIVLCGCARQTDVADNRMNHGVVIALLDTGVSSAAIKSENLISGWNYVFDTSDTEDNVNHGTAVASVILGSESAGIVGTAPEAKVVPLTVSDKVDGEITVVSSTVLAQAIRDCVDQYNASIINISLGSKTDDPKIRAAIKYVQSQGALVIAAAGNSGESTDLYYPAAYDGVLAVGSHDKTQRVSDFTPQSDIIDILAPGEDVWLASRNGKTYGAKGTSYAVGKVSAAAALIWEKNPKFSAKNVEKELLSTADTVDDWKILNMEALFN